MGLSCGNPTATANLREGETVVDLGSGGGLDVFLAAAKVGPTGRAIVLPQQPRRLRVVVRPLSCELLLNLGIEGRTFGVARSLQRQRLRGQCQGLRSQMRLYETLHLRRA